ncbi:hypothetical protein MMC15_006542 [Xylographa vitiligo]|nr:hypothetical protein [Xylographa vitiligo]
MADGSDQRHNQECQYLLSKKRQSSKKSVGSVSSDKSAECRSPLDDTSNTAADVHVEATNGVQVSPGPTFSPIRIANPLVNGLCNSLPGRPSLSDHRNTVRTVPEDAAWSIATDRNGALDLPPVPPPTDIRIVPDSDAFSWPLFTTDADWEFDFDIPFTAEQTSASTDASSTVLNELEVSQLYNRPTQGFDSAGCSGQLIEYLSLSEKVSIDTAFLA